MTKIESMWIVGFVDGEGYFHIGIAQNSTYKLGIQVLPEFVITQHQRDIKLLYAIKDFFGCGYIIQDKRGICQYRVRTHTHLLDIIIPFFERHSLKTMKKIDFLKFRKVVLLMEKGEHLTLEGLQKIRKIREELQESNSNCNDINSI